MNEAAARKYCELMGLDPDEEIEHSGCPSESGAVTSIVRYSPRWEIVADAIQRFSAMLTAIESTRDNRPKPT